MNSRRPCLAYPFTVLTQPDIVRLVAGEDYRYTLTGAGLEYWLPDLLGRCTGQNTLATLLGRKPDPGVVARRAPRDVSVAVPTESDRRARLFRTGAAQV